MGIKKRNAYFFVIYYRTISIEIQVILISKLKGYRYCRVAFSFLKHLVWCIVIINYYN